MASKYSKFAQPVAWIVTAVAGLLFLVFVFRDPTPGELPPGAKVESAPEPVPDIPEPAVLSPEVEAADAALTAQVEAALTANPYTKAFKYRVVTRNGKVRVTGDVKGGGQKDNVSAVARSVPGVTRFINDITVHDHGD